MPIGDDTYAYWRHLPHLERSGKTYYVTFCTLARMELSGIARDAVMSAIAAHHNVICWIHRFIVMPDHVHIVVTPHESIRFGELMRRLKGSSSRAANRALRRWGSVWQAESFDHILRSDESLFEKCEYIANNPVRRGLVEHPKDYPWIWPPIARDLTEGCAD